MAAEPGQGQSSQQRAPGGPVKVSSCPKKHKQRLSPHRWESSVSEHWPLIIGRVQASSPQRPQFLL